MSRDWYYTLISLFVVVLGCMNAIIFAFNLDSDSLRNVVRQTAASPLPRPFTDMRGHQQNFSYDVYFVVHHTDGTKYTAEVMDVALSGPHKRKIVYIAAILNAPKDSAFTQTTLQYGFCSTAHPYLGNVTMIPGRVDVHMRSRIPGVTQEWIVPILCSV